MSATEKYVWNKQKCANTSDFWTGYQESTADSTSGKYLYTSVPYNIDYLWSDKSISFLSVYNPSIVFKPGARIVVDNTSNAVINIVGYADCWKAPDNTGWNLLDCGSRYTKAMYITEEAMSSGKNKGMVVWDYNMDG